MTRPRAPWSGPTYEPRDRALAHRLDALMWTTEVAIDRQERHKDAEQRWLRIRVPEGELAGLETITGLAFAVSVRPYGRASAAYALLQCRTWGQPTAIYRDEVRGASDLTLEWHRDPKIDRATLLRAGLRTVAGMNAHPLKLEDVEQMAR